VSLDRFIDWGPFPEWGAPTIERLAQVAADFLGDGWEVKMSSARSRERCWIDCLSKEPNTFALASENKTHFSRQAEEANKRGPRCFEVFFSVEGGEITQTSVITRQSDEFTGALADRYAAIIARWWGGTVRSGG